MTASLIVAGLAALLGSTATVGAIAFAYSLWRDANALRDRFLDAEDNRRRLSASNATLVLQLADRDATVARLNGCVDDLGARLKVAQARAVAGLSDDELRAAVDGLPSPAAHGDGAGTAPAAASLSHPSATAATHGAR